MSAREPAPCMRELVGTSLNASVLRIEGRSPNVETPLLQVAALGAAALHIHHGADRGGPDGQGVPVASVVANPAHQVNPQDALAAELSQHLAHIRFGQQYDALPMAIRLFAQWMAGHARFAGLADRDQLLQRLATRVMHEWLSDRCPRCGGTGLLERLGDGSLVRGRGRRQRNAIFQQCPQNKGCGGTGRPVPSHTARRLALGLPLQRYESEGWGATFKAALTWLERDLGRLTRPLTIQLERSKKRT